MIIHDKYMEEKLMIEIRFHGRGEGLQLWLSQELMISQSI